MSRRLVLILALLSFVVASPAWAATYYVKPAANGGSDAAAGTAIGTAWATLQKAADTVVAGDTVKVDCGTYSNGFRAVSSGTVNNRITFEPLQGTGTHADSGIIINGFAKGSGQLGPVWIGGQRYITVKGFNCTTNTSKGNFQAFGGADGVRFINCRSYGGGNFWGCKITDCDSVIVEGGSFESSAGEHGIYLSGCTNYAIRNTVCKNNNWDGIHTNIGDFAGQTVFNNAHGLIEGNVCFGNRLSGMDLTGLQNSTIRNNLCYGNTKHGVSMQNVSGFVNMPGCSGNLIVNNTFLGSGGAGRSAIRFAATQGGTFSNDANTTVFNNILLGTAGAGSIESFNGVAATFRSDKNLVVDVFRTTSGTDVSLATWRKRTGQDTNSSISTTAATFVDAAGGDYHLLAAAPGVGFGVATFNGLSAPGHDIAGTSRGAVPDAGAYEHAADAGGGGGSLRRR